MKTPSPFPNSSKDWQASASILATCCLLRGTDYQLVVRWIVSQSDRSVNVIIFSLSQCRVPWLSLIVYPRGRSCIDRSNNVAQQREGFRRRHPRCVVAKTSLPFSVFAKQFVFFVCRRMRKHSVFRHVDNSFCILWERWEILTICWKIFSCGKKS